MSKSRLAAIASKATLVQYSQGAAQSSVAPVADYLAPTVEVSSVTGYFKQYDDKTRFVVPDTSRAIGGKAVQLGWAKTDKTYNCKPNSLDVPVDIIEADAEDGDMESALQEAADLGAEVGGLSHEKAVIDAAIKALTAGLSNIDFAADKDPIDQIDTVIATVAKGAGYGSAMGIKLLLGVTFFRRLKNHPKVQGRFVTNGSKKEINPTLEDIMGLFILKPQVRLSAMVYDSEPIGKAAARAFLLDDKCIVFASKDAPTRRDPSFMKTFRKRGQWMAPRVYKTEDERGEVAAFDWSVDVQVTNTEAGKLVGIAN